MPRQSKMNQVKRWFVHNLVTIQEDLQDSILGINAKLESIKQHGNITSSQRIKIHSDTVFENFINSLKITYPGIWKLIGENCAKGAALAYSHDTNNLVSNSEIRDFGENFPEFLKEFESVKHLKYLKDYATLEWLRYRSYQAPNVQIAKLQNIQSAFEHSCIGSYKISFNKSAFFLKSEYPLIDIQSLLDNPDSGNISLKKQESFVAICRVHKKVETLFTEKQIWIFLRALSEGKTIGTAMEIFTQDNVSNQISKAIGLMLEKQMISKITK